MSNIKDTPEQPKVEISVKNFGPIAEANIDLRPLTVFVGPSNTGKTYFATLLYMQYTVFRESYSNPAPEYINSPPTIQEDNLHHKLSELKIIEEAFERYFDVASVSNLMRIPGNDEGFFEILMKLSKVDQEDSYCTFRAQGSKISADRRMTENMLYHLSHSENNDKWYYLPATRSGLMQTNRIVASSLMGKTLRSDRAQSQIPTLSAVVVDFMQHLTLYEENGKPNPEILTIIDALESQMLNGKIVVTNSQSGYPELCYRSDETGVQVSLARTSSMVSELAPLVLYLRGLVQPGDTLVIEEPEAHLHPGAQADIAVILARLVRAGVKVIITTHSDWLLQEIGNLILEGLIENETDEPASWLLPEEVGVWHFQKDTPVKEISFKSRKGISPEDYEDVAEGLYNRSVNLQQKYEKQKGKRSRESV